MITVKDVLPNVAAIEKDLFSQGYNDIEVENIVKQMARQKYQERKKVEEKKAQEAQRWEEFHNSYMGDSFSDTVKRGLITNSARYIQALNYLKGGNVLDEKTNNNINLLLENVEKKKEGKFEDKVEKRLLEIGSKEQLSADDIEETQDIYKRIKAKEKLKKEDEEAKGFIENAIVGVKKGVDVALHPSEWTLEGAVEGLSDPLNYIPLPLGSLAAKLAKSAIKKSLVGAAAGATEGAIVNTGFEYAVAKGANKSDEEVKKIVAQSLGGSVAMGSVLGGAGGFVEGKLSKWQDSSREVKESLKQKEVKNRVLDSELVKDRNGNAISQEETALKFEDILNGEKVDEDTKKMIVDKHLLDNNLNYIKNIAAVEEKSIKMHEETKAKIEELAKNGATLDEMIAFRNSIKLDESEKAITRAINSDELMSTRLSGFRIINAVQDSINSSKIGADEFNKRLIEEGATKELANVATKSYMIKNIEPLQDFIQKRLEDYLEIENLKIKDDINQRVDFYNMKKIADEELWANSISKARIDEFIDNSIGKDNIFDSQRELIYELNKTGLVDNLDVDSFDKKINARYGVDNKNIEVNSSKEIAGITKAQALVHEYVHSATVKFIENPRFKDDLSFLFNEAKESFIQNKKSIKEYGFKNEAEFVAEAFSNPNFAIKLNSVKLSEKAKERLSVKSYVSSLFDAIFQKFSDIVYATTGKRFKINEDSYFETLNEMFKKERNRVENIKDEISKNPELKKESYKSFKNSDDIKLKSNDNVLNMSREAKERYINKNTNRVNLSQILKDAEVLPKPLTKDAFINNFKTTSWVSVDTPYKKVRFNVSEAWKHIDKNNTYFKDRASISGAFEKLLKDPLLIVDNRAKKQIEYYAPFKNPDNPNEAVHLISITKDYKGRLDLKTFFDLEDGLSKVYDLINASELDTKYFKYSSRLQGKDPAGNDIKYQIPKNDLNSESISKTENSVNNGDKNVLNMANSLQDKSIKYDNNVSVSAEKINKEFSSFKNLALENSYFNGIFDFGLLSKDSVDRLKKMTGLNFDGYKRVVDAEHIRHTKNSHPNDLRIYDDLIDIFENFDYARKTSVTNKASGKTDFGIELYRKDKDGLIKYVELRNFDKKELRLKTAFFVDKKSIDQKLPIDLRLWSDADYRQEQQSPQTPRLKTNSDGFSEGSITKNDINSNENVLHSESFDNRNFLKKALDFFKNYDEISNKAVENISNFANGLDKDGNVLKNTNKVADVFRNLFVPDAFIQKKFLDILNQNRREMARLKNIAMDFQSDLNQLPKDDSKLLVMALDGDLSKDKLSDDLRSIYEVIRKKIDDNAKQLVELGVLRQEDLKEDYVKRFYKEHIENRSILSKIFSSGHKLDKQYERLNLSLEQREQLGQIHNAGYVVARTLLEQENQIRKAKFLKTLAEQFSKDSEALGYHQIANDPKMFGALANKYVPEDIYNELNSIKKLSDTFDEVVFKDVNKAILSFSRYIKGNMTAGNISTHLYNVIANSNNLYLNGLIMTRRNGRLVGGSYGANGVIKILNPKSREAYKKELKAVGLYDDNFFTTIIAFSDEYDKSSNYTITKDILNGALFKKGSRFTKAMEDLYDFEDKVFRIFAYEELKWDKKVEKYKAKFGKINKFDKETKAQISKVELSSEDRIKVMDEARDIFVDYSKPVPKWVSFLDNYLIFPFARYTYLASIRQAKTAIKHPIRATLFSLFAAPAVRALFGEFGLDDDDPLKPNYMKTGFTNFNMYFVNNFIKINDDNNKAEYINLGRAIPGFRMFEIGAGIYGDIYQGLINGEDRFGRKFSKNHEEAPEALAKRLSYISELILPPMFPAALPVIWNGPKFTEQGNIKKLKNGKEARETVSIGGRYAQKALGVASGASVDRYDNVLGMDSVIKQFLGVKTEVIDKNLEAKRKIDGIKKEYDPKINKAKNLKQKEKEAKLKEQKIKEIERIKSYAPNYKEKEKEKEKEKKKKKDEFGFQMPKFTF